MAKACGCLADDPWTCARLVAGLDVEDGCECPCHYPDEDFDPEDYLDSLDEEAIDEDEERARWREREEG